MTKCPPVSRWAAAFWKQATCSSCVVRLLIVLKTRYARLNDPSTLVVAKSPSVIPIESAPAWLAGVPASRPTDRSRGRESPARGGGAQSCRSRCRTPGQCHRPPDRLGSRPPVPQLQPSTGLPCQGRSGLRRALRSNPQANVPLGRTALTVSNSAAGGTYWPSSRNLWRPRENKPVPQLFG